MPEILTIDELATLLKMSRRSVYEMTNARGRERMSVPLPVLRINGSVRFRKQDIEKWLDEIAREAA